MKKLNRSFVTSPTKSDPETMYINDFIERPYLPDCWTDNKRMDVLFNPFRIRDINPEGWDLKMNFWINLINKWCLYELKVIFTIDEIRNTFIRDERLPHLDCIKLVITQMKRQNRIMFKDEITNLNNKNNSSSYGPSLANWALNSFIMKPITFGWSLISKDNDNAHTNEDEMLPIYKDYQLINKEILEILSESVDSHMKNVEVTCMSYSKFLKFLSKNVFTEKTIDEASLEIVLCHLDSKNKIKIYEESGFKIVKFGNDTHIKDSDIILVKLELTKEVLEREVSKLEKKMISLNQEARAAIENENNDRALLLLKRKKRLENRLKEKDQQIDNIEVICGQLLESGSQQLMMKTFQMANDVLKKNSLKIEDVENIMSQIDENLYEQSVINAELNRPVGESIQLEMEAEKELEEMLKEKGKALDKSNINQQNNLMDQLNKLSIVDDDHPIENHRNNESTEKCIVLSSE